jgi:lipid-A-disaccharide synthase
VKRIFISAGEMSGDTHGAKVIAALRSRVPELVVEGVGGSQMVAAGMIPVEFLETLSVIGVAEALRSVPEHLRLFGRIKKLFARCSYDAVVLIDYPGFNLRLASAARKAGVPVLYYIVPQLWAWGKWRVKSVRKNVSSLAVVLPFEERFFRARGMAARFVGHPLLDRPPVRTRPLLRTEMNLTEETTVLGLFPGSRHQEVRRLWPAFRQAARMLVAERPGLEVVVAAVNGIEYPSSERFHLWYGRAPEVMAVADAAICKSGTTTLEAALAGTPLVVAYSMHPITYALARGTVRVPFVSLVNLLADRRVVTELLQHDVTPQKLADAVSPLLERSGSEAQQQRRALLEIRSKLGTPGAGARVADMALQLVA